MLHPLTIWGRRFMCKRWTKRRQSSIFSSEYIKVKLWLKHVRLCEDSFVRVSYCKGPFAIKIL